MSNSVKKAVVLGLDGLEPSLVEAYLKDGLLPTFQKLASHGSYQQLATVNPPQSPVAWASFITEASPQQHGVFDFIIRDPQNYTLNLVYSHATGHLKFQAPPFWEKTTQSNLETTIIFLPDTYPPAKIHGHLLSGMGTPDLLGTEATFTLFTTQPTKSKRGQIVPVDKLPTETAILGPKQKTISGVKPVTVPLKIEKIGNQLKIQCQDQTAKLKEGQFSPWLRLTFTIGLFKKIKGIAKFYLNSLKPLKLYLTPINFDPQEPPFPISHPSDWSMQLAKKHGPFSTLGMPMDTWALEEEILTEEAFLDHAEMIQKEQEKIVLDQLESSEAPLIVAYFNIPDPIQHMFWRYLDPQSKINPTERKRFQDVIPQWYQKMDHLLEKVQKNLDPETRLVVLSDHGFGPLHYQINLNSWLEKEGYLVLDTDKPREGEMLGNVNWKKSKAYAIGFNTLYLNLVGREVEGTVKPEDADQLLDEIGQKLKNWHNKKANEAVVKNVYPRTAHPLANEPDLIVGYHKGYRASWATALGETPKNVLEKREAKWAGDHQFDASEVPGVLFTNQKINLEPDITKIMPAVLKYLGISA